MKYSISYYQPHLQNIKIRAEFNIKKNKETTLVFPNWRPGRYELGNFAKNISQFNVFDQNNKKLNFHKSSTNTWLVESIDANKLIIEYHFFSAELNAGSTFMDENQLYVNPVNCLIYIETLQLEACELTVNIPENFEIAAGIEFKDNVLSTKDFHELVDTPFICSPILKKYSYQVKENNFHLWFQGEVQIDWPKIKSDFIKFTRQQINKFGDIPVKDYHFIYQITPFKSYHGVEHQHSTVIALGPTYDLMGGLYDDFLGISSHELYHTWNIKNIRPLEMMPYNYSSENFSLLGYIAEGVTTYMGDLFLSYSKVKSWAWYKHELEILFQKHFENYGRFNYSVTESSWDTWLDGYVKGIPNRKVSIYNEGALLAFYIDLKIRTVSANIHSLHDVMTYMYENFGKKNKGYTESDYKLAIKEYLKEDPEEFFQKYIHNSNSYEQLISDALEMAGLELNTIENPNFAQRLLGIKYSIKSTITDICPGSTSDLASLMVGDKIIAINGNSVNGDLHKWVEFYKDDQIELTIIRKGQAINKVCPNTNRNHYPIYKIEKMKIPSSLNTRVFKKWTGYKWLE